MDYSPPEPLSVGFSRQEYWSEFLFSPLGDLPAAGIKPTSPALAGRFSTTEPPALEELEIIQHREHRMVTDEQEKVGQKSCKTVLRSLGLLPKAVGSQKTVLGQGIQRLAFYFSRIPLLWRQVRAGRGQAGGLGHELGSLVCDSSPRCH